MHAAVPGTSLYLPSGQVLHGPDGQLPARSSVWPGGHSDGRGAQKPSSAIAPVSDSVKFGAGWKYAVQASLQIKIEACLQLPPRQDLVVQ